MSTSMFVPGRIARLAGPALLAAALLLAVPGGASAQTAPSSTQTGTSSAAPTRTSHIRHAHPRRKVAPKSVAALPPTPQVQPVASVTSPAPVPNEAVSPPDQPAPKTEIAPSVFQLHYPPVGEGYVTGSSPQAMDDRNAAKATGVQMKVPLPQ